MSSHAWVWCVEPFQKTCRIRLLHNRRGFERGRVATTSDPGQNLVQTFPKGSKYQQSPYLEPKVKKFINPCKAQVNTRELLGALGFMAFSTPADTFQHPPTKSIHQPEASTNQEHPPTRSIKACSLGCGNSSSQSCKSARLVKNMFSY